MLTIKICLALASFFLVTAKNPEEAGFFEGDIMGVVSSFQKYRIKIFLHKNFIDQILN